VPDADVVVATWWETAEWVWRLSSSKGTKVHFMQDYETWGGGVERVDATCRLPIPKIVASRWIRDLLAERFQQVALACIPYGVDTTRFFAVPRTKQSVPTVGLTYTTFKNKGCDVSLRAFGLACQAVPELRLVAYGNMPVSRDLPLPPDATYLCKVTDEALRHTYAQCDAWLFGTRVEGFGLPILEAMACRTPVIATPAGAAPELLEHGVGMVVEPEDPDSMARAIVALCRMPDEQWQALSDVAHRRATGYSWDEATRRFEAALTQAQAVASSHLRA
jgi:glycosyltransferase involved in cell wall biosynthesis